MRLFNRIGEGPLARYCAIVTVGVGLLASIWFSAGFAFKVLAGAKEKDHQFRCRNQMRMLGEATNFYHEDQSAFPRAFAGNAKLEKDKRLSWIVGVLPYMRLAERVNPGEKRLNPYAKIYPELDKDKPWDSPVNLEALQGFRSPFACPSRPEEELSDAKLGNYVGLTGVGPDSADIDITNPDAGFFGYQRKLTRDNIDRGTSNTMLATETGSQNGPWLACGPATLRAVDPALVPYIGLGRPFGGLHPSGAMVLFVDGSARIVANSMQPSLWEDQARIHKSP